MEEVMVQNNKAKYIVVRIDKEQFGIDIHYVDNIVRMQSITRVPQVPKYYKGVINLRGEIIPVMSLRIKMGYEEDTYAKDTRIIILKPDQQESIGIIVDQVKEVVDLEDDQIEKIAYDKDDKKPFAFGVGKKDAELISLLDINVVIMNKENA